uniref:Uncharacterized protein n=1 Tax=Sphaerodactylus townsendi TaxID=933632 RepID=A0ACB8G7L0_9SAUR
MEASEEGSIRGRFAEEQVGWGRQKSCNSPTDPTAPLCVFAGAALWPPLLRCCRSRLLQLLLRRQLSWLWLANAYSAGGGPSMEKPVEAAIQTKLQEALQPVPLEVMSSANHMQDVPRGARETHFRVAVASRVLRGPLPHPPPPAGEATSCRKRASPARVHALSIPGQDPAGSGRSLPAVGRSPGAPGGAKPRPRTWPVQSGEKGLT